VRLKKKDLHRSANATLSRRGGKYYANRLYFLIRPFWRPYFANAKIFYYVKIQPQTKNTPEGAFLGWCG